MGTKELNRRLDRATPSEKGGEWLFSEAEYRRAVKAAERFLKECATYHKDNPPDPPLTKAEEKENEEAIAGYFAWWREEYKDENARLVNPVHVLRLIDENNEG